MTDWKDAASKAHEDRGPVTETSPSAATGLSRPDARKAVEVRLVALGILAAGEDIGVPAEDHSHVDVEGASFYIGQAGELWGHVKTDDGEHSWDMPIRTLADAGELLAHKADMDNGIHPAPRPEGPMEAKAEVGS